MTVVRVNLLILAIVASFAIVTGQFDSNNDNKPFLRPDNEPAEACAEQIRIFQQAHARGELWTDQMLDAASKGQTGVLYGNYLNLGQYDECVNIHEATIKGKYCLTYVNDKEITLKNGPGPNRLFGFGYLNAICIPDKCDINELLRAVNMTSLLVGNESQCQVKEDTQFGAVGVTLTIALIVYLIWLGICTYVNMRGREEKESRGTIDRLTKMFSIYVNGTTLFKTTKNNSKKIACLDGIRVLSMLAIVMGHRFCMGYVISTTFNRDDLEQFFTSYAGAFIVSTTHAVDTFLLLSGFLVVNITLKYMERGRVNWLMFYLHRYVRLLVGLTAILIFVLFYVDELVAGPFWKIVESVEINPCHRYWWSYLLSVQNYVNGDEICLSHTWYLSVDMQLYLISPFVIYLIARFRRISLIVLICIIFLLQALTFWVVWSKELSFHFMVDIFNERVHDWNLYYYQPTHTRAVSWFIGALLAYYFHYEKPTRFGKTTVTTLWIVSIVSLLLVILIGHHFIQLDYTYDKFWDTCYVTFSKTVWSLSLCWMITACHFGYGGAINWFLSLECWQPLVKLSYGVYLIHIIQQACRQASSRTPRYFSPYELMFEFCGDLLSLSIYSAILALVFELPLFNLETFLTK